MRVVLYIRVSTEEQSEEGYSIAAQRDRLNAFCHSQGWTIVETYTEEGQSAKDLDRPQLKRLLSDAEKGLFDCVLVYKLDRLTRSVLDLYTLLQKFENYNVKFRSASEVYDTTTAIGRLFITLVAALAQWERENLTERVRFGMEQMVREGKRPGAKIPYGYEKTGEVIPDEKKILREIRQMYLDGEGFRSIAQILNRAGKLRRGKTWSAQTVYYIMDNPYYAGKIRWGSKKANGKYSSRKKEDMVECIFSDSDHEKIFTWKEYEEHTNKMKLKSFKGHNKSNEYWFSGVLKCAKCGSAMTGRFTQNKKLDGTINKIVYYICANRQMGQDCKMPMFRQVLVENLILEWIAKQQLDSGKLKQLNDDQPTEELDKLNELYEKIGKVKERKKQWQYMFAEQMISREDFQERNNEEEEQLIGFNQKIQTIENKISQSESETQAFEVLLTLPIIWNGTDDKGKKQLIQTIFKTIELDTPVEVSAGNGKKGQFIPAEIKSIEYQ